MSLIPVLFKDSENINLHKGHMQAAELLFGGFFPPLFGSGAWVRCVGSPVQG